MRAKHVYLLLYVVGFVLPYWQFVPWVAANGLNMSFFFQQLLANRISAFFAMDVVVSAVTLLVFSRVESARLGITGRWWVVLAVLTVGVSLGLPLFLYLRERKLESSGQNTGAEAG